MNQRNLQNSFEIQISCIQKETTFDKDLLAPKLWFFLHMASLSCITPYFCVFYRSVGLNSEQIGILGAIRPFINSFGGPVCGLIADKSHQHKNMLLGGVTLSVLIRFSMLFSNGSFALICALLIASEFAGSGVTPLLDNTVLEILGNERVTAYGKQRLTGAFGWGLTALIVGILVSYFQDESIYFYSHLIVGLTFFIAVIKFPVADTKESSVDWRNAFKVFFYSMDTILFFLIIFVMGLAVGIYFNFLFIYLRELGASSLLMGVVLMCNSLSDVTFMFISGTIIRKIGSHFCLHIALLAYALRIFNYSIIPSAWYVLPGELLQGITWGLAWSAGINYAQSISPSGLGATTQGLVAGMIGLGNGCGSLIGGFMYEQKGAIFTFRATAILMLIALVVFVISGFFSSKCNSYGSLSQSFTENEVLDMEMLEEEDEWSGEALVNSDEGSFDEIEDKIDHIDTGKSIQISLR